MSRSKKIRLPLFAAFALAAMLLITACDGASTTTASCAFVVGDNTQGHDAKLDRVVLPGQRIGNTENVNVSYVPCNQRTYIINDGNVYNPNIIDEKGNQQRVGDKFVPILAYTSTGVPIRIQASADWRLNQSEKALRAFYELCFKFTCFSGKDAGGGANFSTPGWNGMLAEVFAPAMEMVARRAAINIDDTIWQNHNQNTYDKLAVEMSRLFADAIRPKSGTSVLDLFCGGSNSAWPNPNKPGEDEFICAPVFIEVSDVQVVPQTSDESGTAAIALNKQRLENARAKYGDGAEYWLGLQDTVEKCNEANITCVFNIGSTGANVSVPVPSSAPAPTPTPAKK